MTAIAVDQLNPANGDVADGRRVLMQDGSHANIAKVGAELLVIHAGVEFGPFPSTWRVLDELARIDLSLSAKNSSVIKGANNAA